MKPTIKTAPATPTDQVHGLYSLLARALISHPEHLESSARDNGSTILVSATAHADDHGKIIGTGGANIKALTLLLQVAAARHRKRFKLYQNDPKVGERCAMHPFVAAKDWDHKPLAELLRATCLAVFSVPFEVTVEDVGDVTSLTVTISQERLPFEDVDVKIALATIFDAIGKAWGRVTHLDLDRAEQEAKC